MTEDEIEQIAQRVADKMMRRQMAAERIRVTMPQWPTLPQIDPMHGIFGPIY